MTYTQAAAADDTRLAESITLRPVVERQAEPRAIDTLQPRFSWRYETSERGVQQRSFHIQVSDDEGRLVWNSGPRPGGRQIDIVYEGTPLQSARRYDWTLEVDLHTPRGTRRLGARSFFETALFHASDWSDARWIAAPPEPSVGGRRATPSPVLSTRVPSRDGLRSARLYVAAGGLVVSRINGARVGDAELVPAVTDFDHRVQYMVDDVTSLLKPGENTLGLQLGRGFYGMTNPSPPPAWEWESAPWHAEPCVRAILILRFGDGSVETVTTGADWASVRSGTLSDDLYGGEVFDAGATAPAKSCEIVAGPRGVLCAAQHQPIRRITALPAVAVTGVEGDRFVVDFGRVLSGWARISARGPAGHRLVLRFGEKLTAAGRPNVEDGLTYFPEGFQTDVFILAGTGGEETWRPSFTYHGFRYVEVDGWLGTSAELAASIEAELVHTDAPRTGAFECSSEALNALHAATVDTIAINLHGIPTDTPTYEKNGWTGDGMLGTEMFLFNFDLHLLLAKWLDDIVDSIDDVGRPQIIAPSPGWGDRYKPSPTWHSDLVLLPWWLHRHRGDVGILQRHWTAIERYVVAEYDSARNGIADTVLNDWCSPETGAWGGEAPDDHRVSGTAFLYVSLRSAADIGRAVGRSEAAAALDERADAVAEAFAREFFDEARGIVRGVGDEGYRQTHTVLALAFGLLSAPRAAAALEALVADLEARGRRLNTGVLGTKYLLRVLTRSGYGELAHAVATQPEFPGWGYWLASGATTLWEHWRPESRSRSHYFLGTTDDWLYGDVLGIRPTGPGFSEVTIDPARIASIQWARGQVDTPYGLIRVDVRDDAGARALRVEVPVGVTADLCSRGAEGSTRRRVGSGTHLLVAER